MNLFLLSIYSIDLFDTTKTLADLYELDYNEDHTTEIYVVEAIIEFVDTGYYTAIKLKSTDGKTTLSLYCSSGSQYSFLSEFYGKTVTLELAICNWNSKTYYVGCVASATYEGKKIMKDYNFDE